MMMAFQGQRLREARDFWRVSQDGLADALNELRPLYVDKDADELGVITQQHISKWESGTNEPSTLMLTLLVRALNVSADYLLGESSSMFERLIPTEPSEAFRVDLLKRKGFIRKARKPGADRSEGGK